MKQSNQEDVENSWPLWLWVYYLVCESAKFCYYVYVQLIQYLLMITEANVTFIFMVKLIYCLVTNKDYSMMFPNRYIAPVM